MAEQVLTARDREIIASHTHDEPGERYPEIPAYAFKGRRAFDLHLRLVRLVDDWESRFTEAQKDNCALLVTVRTTVSKATLKNPAVAPVRPRRKIFLYFYSKEQMVPSGSAYGDANGKRWLAALDAEPGNLL
jgi:hypothetical protein